MTESPSVAVVVPNRNGVHHLAACLGSVSELRYDGEVEVVVVDDASTDESRSVLAKEWPTVRVVANDENLGFAASANAGAEAATSSLVAFLNNDMRVEPTWLAELVRAYDPERGYRCVAATILDWSGERLDFGGGFVNFHGAAGQLLYGVPVGEVDLEDGRELPFACGGAMLVDRSRFLELGGLDPTFYALVEDVDYGWRSWLAGDRVRLAAGARCRHRHSATTSLLGRAELAFLSERNALRMLIKNLEDAHLAPVLAAAMLLLTERAALETGETARAPLRAAAAVVAELDILLEQRVRVQRLRRRSDAEVFRVFGSPLIAVRGEDEYLEAAARVSRAFGLDRLFEGVATPPQFIGAEPAPTEPLGQLLAKWRNEFGVDRSAAWHFRRAVWRGLPAPLRRRLRPSVGRQT
jgi:GT2 family glycosyltransferase